MRLWLTLKLWIVIVSTWVYSARIWNETNDISSALTTQNFIWSRIEPCASIIAACLPTYGPLIPKGHFLASIIRSAISLVTLGSAGSKSSKHNTGEGPSSNAIVPVKLSESKRSWSKLSNVESQQGNDNDDIQKIMGTPNGIHVSERYEVEAYDTQT